MDNNNKNHEKKDYSFTEKEIMEIYKKYLPGFSTELLPPSISIDPKIIEEFRKVRAEKQKNDKLSFA